jgi:hypothetical protein
MHKLGRHAIRVAISIDASNQDADVEFLREFVSDPSNLITHEDAIRLLPRLLRVASTSALEESDRDMALPARQNTGDDVIW